VGEKHRGGKSSAAQSKESTPESKDFPSRDASRDASKNIDCAEEPLRRKPRVEQKKSLEGKKGKESSR